MKYRKDFVTNSSSSSFVCEICGNTESGFDLGLRDAEMIECVNGHVFCEEHMLPFETDKTRQEMVDELMANEWFFKQHANEIMDCSDDEVEEYYFQCIVTEGCNFDAPESVCPICQFIEYSEYDLANYLENKYGIDREEVFAEVKQHNRRRKKLYESEYITYVCKKYDLNPAEIVAGWKSEFGSYENLKKYLRNNAKKY